MNFQLNIQAGSDFSNSHTDTGKKYFPTFVIEIKDEDDELVAVVKKTLFVRKKKITKDF